MCSSLIFSLVPLVGYSGECVGVSGFWSRLLRVTAAELGGTGASQLGAIIARHRGHSTEHRTSHTVHLTSYTSHLTLYTSHLTLYTSHLTLELM